MTREINMASEDEEPEELRIVLVGESGSGKSATGNTILRKREFTIRESWLRDGTLTCQIERGEFEGTPVSVVDTPWSIWWNTTEMSKCISDCAPGPHAFLVVIKLKRYTTMDRLVKYLQRTYGEEASRYTIVLFTRGDKLPDGVTAEEFIHPNPVPYGVGYHVFNNRSEDPSQVRELLEKIKRMVQRNGGSYCIKLKDWKDKYLYPFASAVTIGVGVGAASGGTGGVLLAASGSTVGAYAAEVGGNRGIAGAIAVAAVVGLAGAIGDDLGTGAGIAGKATAAIVAGAGTAGAAFEVFDYIDGINVRVEAMGVISGAAVGAGVSAAVGVNAPDAVAGAIAGAVFVLAALLAVLDKPSSISIIAGGLFRIAGVSAGAAFGAAVGVLGAPGLVIITIICQAVTWWLNRKA